VAEGLVRSGDLGSRLFLFEGLFLKGISPEWITGGGEDMLLDLNNEWLEGESD
jgi:hypothetical protein